MSQFDRHPTTEQLSAFLDGQAEEPTHVEEHLRTCEQCRLRLADLRQTVALLHALPQPELPRSFVLPADTSHVVPIPAAASRPPHEGRTSASRVTVFPAYLRNTLRVVSTLAALLGIIFLFSALPLGHSGVSVTTSGGSANNADAPKNALPATATPPTFASTQENAATAQVQRADAASTATARANPTTAITPPQQPSALNGGSPQPSPFALTTPTGRAIWGATLLVIGILGILLLRRLRRQL